MDPLKWLYKKLSFYVSMAMGLPSPDDIGDNKSDVAGSGDINYVITDGSGRNVVGRESADSSSSTNNSGT
jgi:hypothetical protein